MELKAVWAEAMLGGGASTPQSRHRAYSTLEVARSRATFPALAPLGVLGLARVERWAQGAAARWESAEACRPSAGWAKKGEAALPRVDAAGAAAWVGSTT